MPKLAVGSLLAGVPLAWQRLRGALVLERVVAIVLFALAVAYAVAGAGFFAQMNAPLHFDDGYVAAVAARLANGHFLPYVDAASHRGPGFYFLAAVAQALGGWTEWVGIRWLASSAFVLSVVTLFAAGVAARRPAAGGIAALLFTYLGLCVFETETVFGMVSEPSASVFLLLALLAAAVALCRQHGFARRTLLVTACGVLTGLAGLTKQTYLPSIAPFTLWAAAFAWSEPAWSRRQRVGFVFGLLGGFLLPLVTILVVYASIGQLSTFYYWSTTYNRDVYMGPYGPGAFWRELRGWLFSHGQLAIALVVVLLASAQRVVVHVVESDRPLFRAYRDAGFEATCALQAACALFGTIIPLRFWTQYELPPAPWIVLLIGLGLERWRGLGWSPARVGSARAAVAALTGLALVGFTVPLMDTRVRTWRQQRKNGQWHAARPEPLCKVIDTYAKPAEPLFIWGFDADIYVTCARFPASRYVYMTFVAGVVPGFWDDPQPRYIAPHAREDVLADLERTRPPVILDFPGRMGKFHMADVPSLGKLLKRDYCAKPNSQTGNGRSFKVYVRKDRCQ
jgi:hypothetical protein